MNDWPPDATDYCEICEQYIYNGKVHYHHCEPIPNAHPNARIVGEGTPIQVAYTTREVNAEFFVDAVRNYHAGITHFYFDDEAHINPATLVR